MSGKIVVERQVPAERIAELKARSWPIWEKEVSCFPYTYDETEICLILDGEVTVTPDGGEAVTVGPGDLVTFEDGLACTWDITKAIRKHYNFP